jgi:receptor protein-tyrosine kinase
MSRETHQERSTLRVYLDALRRRRLILVIPVVLVPVLAFAFSVTQPPLYQSSAEVLVARQNLAASLTGIEDPTLYQPSDRILQTQADLARVPEIAERTVRETSLPGRTAESLLSSSTVAPKENSDILAFVVTDGDQDAARELATAYATEYIAYRQELDSTGLTRAREQVQERIKLLEETDQQSSRLYETLLSEEQQLSTLQVLQTANATLIRSAGEAVQVQPRPLRNMILGLIFGLVLGIGLVFAADAIDTRVRSSDEIAEILEMPILGKIPPAPRDVRRRLRPVMLARPDSPEAEAFRLLRTSLEFANLDGRYGSVMITSAVAGEGKTTTAANLAVAVAREGRAVTVVDLDLRQPMIDTYFGLPPRPGLTDVVLGNVSLKTALFNLPLGSPSVAQRSTKNGPRTKNGARNATGRTLRILGAGTRPPDPAEFVSSEALAQLLLEIRETSDLVIIDTPPLLQVGDALALSWQVDAVVLVASLRTRRPHLRDVANMLVRARATALGVVVTGVPRSPGYAYGYGTIVPEERGVATATPPKVARSQ